jgi:hypothetical protein
MRTDTRSKIFEFIKKHGQASPHDLVLHFGITNAAVHRQLNTLVAENSILKLGTPPKVFYIPYEQVVQTSTVSNLPDEVAQVIESTYLYINPDGVVLKGVLGFFQWAMKTNQAKHIQALAKEYVKARTEANTWFGSKKWIDATSKVSTTFPDTQLDAVFYADFYALPKFGKTKLGQLTLNAKLSQSRVLITEVATEVKSTLQRIITDHDIDAVAYIPHSLPRRVPFLKVFREEVALQIPEITLQKAYPGEVRVAQKSLSKLEERIENAQKTIFVREHTIPYKRVLIIDDAVGSGATLNETASKLKNEYGVPFVAGFAVVGSYKGFEVIKEV